MRGYTKDMVQTHADGFRTPLPAINVKVHNWPMPHELAERLDVTEDVAEKLSEMALKLHTRIFWSEMDDYVRLLLGWGKVYQEGRSGGWLVVDGWNNDVESWDAIVLNYWAIFVKEVKWFIRRLTSIEWILDTILSRKWMEVNDADMESVAATVRAGE